MARSWSSHRWVDEGEARFLRENGFLEGMSREEVARLFKVTYNLKYKALLMTAYSAGLQVGEVVRLKVSDISHLAPLLRDPPAR
jgi:site-specific recombinase XerD